MATRGVVFQCGACRSLVSVHSAVADKVQDRAGLACAMCGAVTWLAYAVPGAAHVVDVDTTGDAQAPRQLPVSSSSSSTSALAPIAPNTSLAATVGSSMGGGFDEEQRGRIGERLLKLSAAGAAQEDLSVSFERLLGRWSSDGEHKQFLQKASMIGELAFAGQRYRAILEVAPGDVHAKRAQQELLGLAMATMGRDKDLAQQGARGVSKNAVAIVVLIVTVVICAALLIYMPEFLRPGEQGESMDAAP